MENLEEEILEEDLEEDLRPEEEPEEEIPEEKTDKMTLFYSKQTGDIKGYTTGITDMGYFGNDEVDMEIIYDFIVADLDNYVLDNASQFKIVDRQIKLKEEPDLEKYL